MFALAIVIDPLLATGDAFDTMDGSPVANLLFALAWYLFIRLCMKPTLGSRWPCQCPFRMRLKPTLGSRCPGHS